MRKTLTKKVFVIPCVVNIASNAHADVVRISALLAEGYEVKAAYAVQTLSGRLGTVGSYGTPTRLEGELAAGEIEHDIILQKGSSVYKCSSAYAKFDYEYLCYPALDWEKP